MRYAIGVRNPENVDPLLALLRAECETVEDEFDVESLFEQYETAQLAAQHKTSLNTKD
jgi:hypothetical protein